MAENSNIEWCDHTFNPWIGCTKVSPACDHCYAEGMMDTRLGQVKWGAGEARKRTSEANWRKPLQWAKNADVFGEKHGRRQRVFCASLADVFDNEVPPEWRLDLIKLIDATPELNWLLLTKRVGNVMKMMRAMVPDFEGFPRNIFIGATICNQEEADRDIPKLLEIPAVRFLSMEPLLGPVDPFRPAARWLDRTPHEKRKHIPLGGRLIDWIIAGGESGSDARPMNPQWVRDIRDQCDQAQVPFLFKQWGEWVSVSEVEGPQTAFHTFEDGRSVRRVGKKAAGRTLDGQTHDGFPELEI